MTRWISLSARVFALLSLGVALLSLGGAVNGWLDVLTHFTPVTLSIGVLAGILALASERKGRRLSIIMAAVAIFIAAGMMVPDLVSTQPLGGTRSSNTQVIKVVQINLWSFNVDPVGTAKWIAIEDPDIVVVEEATGYSLITLALLHQKYPYITHCPARVPCTTRILSKHQPTRAGIYPSPDSFGRHSGAWATLADANGAFTVVGVHSLWPVPPDPRQIQTHRLAESLKDFDRSSLILAGDFNATPWSFALGHQDNLFGITRRTHGLFTWPTRPWSRHKLWAPLPFLALDHVYAGSVWQTVSARRGPKLGSIHLPVVVELARPLLARPQA